MVEGERHDYPDGEHEHLEPKKGLCGYCGSNEHDVGNCPKLHEKHGEKEEPVVTIYPKGKEADTEPSKEN